MHTGSSVSGSFSPGDSGNPQCTHPSSDGCRCRWVCSPLARLLRFGGVSRGRATNPTPSPSSDTVRNDSSSTSVSDNGDRSGVVPVGLEPVLPGRGLVVLGMRLRNLYPCQARINVDNTATAAEMNWAVFPAVSIMYAAV